LAKPPADPYSRDLEVARIYELRTEAGLTHRQLAKLVGMSPSAICRLETGDYEGHSLSMLRRIATALSKRGEIRFVRRKRNRQPEPTGPLVSEIMPICDS
jgi:transcriptional regulator with XRE-family HTH domain